MRALEPLVSHDSHTHTRACSRSNRIQSCRKLTRTWYSRAAENFSCQDASALAYVSCIVGSPRNDIQIVLQKEKEKDTAGSKE